MDFPRGPSVITKETEGDLTRKKNVRRMFLAFKVEEEAMRHGT